MVINNNLLFLFLLNLFILGIKNISKLIFLKSRLLPINGKDQKDNSNYAISTLLGIFFFCIISNLILLIPSLIFLIRNSLIDISYYIYLASNILKVSVIIISLIGFKDLIKINKIFKEKKNNFSSIEFDKNLFLSLFISSLIYLIFSPKSIASGIQYDTGLYYLPYINHLSKFTIEPGLANLHFRYGFYGLSFFGQVPFQMFSKSTNYLSPSLNIGFLAIYISYFLPYLKEFKLSFIYKILNNKVIFSEKVYPISILYFCLSMILFTGGIFKSLSSYSLDLPLFICGSISFHLIILSFFKKYNLINFIPIFWLAFFSPIIKLTGIVIPLFLILFLSSRLIRFLFLENRVNNSSNLYRSLNIILKKCFRFLFDLRIYVNYKLSIIFIIFSISVFILTNYIITGYPFYPLEWLGSFQDFSLEPESIKNIRIDTLNWHRFQGNPININDQSWFIVYLSSKNGLLNILFWFIPSISSLLIIAYIKIFKRNCNYNFNLNTLLISLISTISICFFKLIPLVNYYSWIPHQIVFLMLILFNRTIKITNIKINFTKITFLSLSLFVVLQSFFSYSNSLIIKNIPTSIFKEPMLTVPDYETFKIDSNKWLSFNALESSKTIKISAPINGDQCWGINPPCTYSKNHLVK